MKKYKPKRPKVEPIKKEDLNDFDEKLKKAIGFKMDKKGDV
jgi:hypothetical protein